MISSEAEIPAKPFADTQEKQLHFVSSFDDIEMSRLKDFPEEAREIMIQSGECLTAERISRICRCMEDNLERLEDCMLQAQNKVFFRAAEVPEYRLSREEEILTDITSEQ